MMIADRLLTLNNSATNIKIAIRIFAPEAGSNGNWFCRYEIDWPDKKSEMRVGGVDSAQALVLALQIIGAEIYSSSYHEQGNLFWDSPGQGYGFPVVPTYRDLLQGDDAKYL
jgi:hypothetical protein